MKVLVTGANGQLGRCLQERLSLAGINYLAVSSSELDITNRDNVRQCIFDFKPDVIINSAAYTLVDKAETDQEQAYAVNCLGPENLSLVASEFDCVLLHVSTDYVFDGASSIAYKEGDETNPKTVYGLTKLQGEKAVASNLKKHITLRTAWVFSEYGSNFLKTMLRLGKERDSLSIVGDQMGCPTYAGDIAFALIEIAKQTQKENVNDALWGLYHYNGDVPVSWYQFAKQIFRIAAQHKDCYKQLVLNDISSSEYPTAAIRPEFSVLDTNKVLSLGVKSCDWQASVRKLIDELLIDE